MLNFLVSLYSLYLIWGTISTTTTTTNSTNVNMYNSTDTVSFSREKSVLLMVEMTATERRFFFPFVYRDKDHFSFRFFPIKTERFIGSLE